ncbi:MAG: M23 family metallopeptidase [Bacteroidota bacterium]
MEQKDEKGRMENLRKNYRLVIMNDETFEEKGSYKLSRLNVYTIIGSASLLVAVMVASLIVFTPLKRFIPGYGDVSKHAELLRLNKKIDALEDDLSAQKLYADKFRKMVLGDYQPDVVETEATEEIPDSLLNVPRIEEDEALRREIEMDQRIQEQAMLSRTVNFSPRDRPIEQMYFMSPVQGEISAGYMPDKKHFGVDVLAPKNTAIKAAMDGFVITSDWTLETGNTLGIQHANNVITFYKHNSVLLKKVGDYVKSGEAIAIIGNTGTLTDGPHLHFELWHKGKPIDPLDYVGF